MKLWDMIMAYFHKLIGKRTKRRELYVCRNCGTEFNYRYQTIFQNKKYGLRWHHYVKCPACHEKLWLD